MDELTRILEAYGAAAGQRVCLATIVKITGSSYRRPGAHMLIRADGTAIGSISGGCLEQDVIAHAEKLGAGHESVVLTYDTASEEDLIFGAGVGCKGVIEILLERAGGRDHPASVDRMLAFLPRTREERRTAVVATVFKIEGGAKGCIGQRHASDNTGVAFSEIGDPELREKVAKDSREALRTGRSVTNRYEVQGGAAEVFIHVIQAPVALVIYGAGNDAMPLSRLARQLGFHITVVDRRPAFATAERFPEADGVMILPAGKIADVNLNERTAAVIMSHHYESDRSCLKALLGVPLRYLGLMGPRRRAEQMLQDLRDDGMLPGAAALQNLHNPVGLDIGADKPDQIALSILAEIQAVFSGHSAGFLRDKKGAVHARRAILGNHESCHANGARSAAQLDDSWTNT